MQVRRLFGVSRQVKAQPNDADRLRKYLARFAHGIADDQAVLIQIITEVRAH